MAEIMEEKKELTPAETAAPASPETPAKRAEKSTADKKKRRRLIRRIIAIALGNVRCYANGQSLDNRMPLKG